MMFKKYNHKTTKFELYAPKIFKAIGYMALMFFSMFMLSIAIIETLSL